MQGRNESGECQDGEGGTAKPRADEWEGECV
jgi:hypothetical protein